MSARLGLGHVDTGAGPDVRRDHGVVIGGTPLSGGAAACGARRSGVLMLAVLANGMVFIGVTPYLRRRYRRHRPHAVVARRGTCAAA